MDEIQTQRAMASTAVMCWKWRKNPPTETARTEREEKNQFRQNKAITNRFRYSLSELRFFSLRILRLR